MKQYSVTFYPDNRKVIVDSGTSILAAAILGDVELKSDCGGQGVCAKCKVIRRSGTVRDEAGAAGLSREEKSRGVLLACQSFIESDIEVEVPVFSRLAPGLSMDRGIEKFFKKMLAAQMFDLAEAKSRPQAQVLAPNPLVRKVYLEMSAPDFDDKLSDLERVWRAVEEKTGLEAAGPWLAGIRDVGPFLRQNHWRITAAWTPQGQVADCLFFDAGDTSTANFGLAVDIGTTTISGQLIDLNTGKVLAQRGAYNRQAIFGADVISRIIYAQSQEGKKRLREAVLAVLNEMADIFMAESGVRRQDVSCMCLAGNPTMLHLFLGIDPAFLRQEPYVPAVNFFPEARAAELDLHLNPQGLVFCLPGVSSYVGADITAGVFACGMHTSGELNLLIDIGTNGEIVLGQADWLISCAASAGPAFEGSGMSWGLRAMPGAIENVVIKEQPFEVECKTIGGAAACGICGSGYISLVSQLLGRGLLDKNGRFKPEMAPERIRQGQDGFEFVVVFGAGTAGGRDMVITEADIDNLKRAKAAIFSGVWTLLRHMDMRAGDIHRIYVAGGFGISLDVESAIQIGLLPDVDREKFVFVGNSSLAGVRGALLSVEAFEGIKKIARNMTYFELSTDAQYMDEYSAALFFPHTQGERFPMVNYAR